MQGTWVQFLGQEDRLGREWLTPPVFFPGEFHGQRSLAGYSPWGHRELDTIGTTHTHTRKYSVIKHSFYGCIAPISLTVFWLRKKITE